jgi:hypothetical protein
MEDFFFSFALKQNISILFWIFLSVYTKLCDLPESEISYENILEIVLSLKLEGAARQELAEYSGVIYETLLKPKYRTFKGPFLVVKMDIIKNVETYFQTMLKILDDRKLDSDLNIKEIDLFLSAFRREVENHLEFSKLTQAREVRGEVWSNTETPQSSRNTTSSTGSSQPKQRVLPASGQNSLLTAFLAAPREGLDATNNSIERNDGVVRLLAYIRKGGMDIIFPQLLHDKVSEKKYYIYAENDFFSLFRSC